MKCPRSLAAKIAYNAVILEGNTFITSIIDHYHYLHVAAQQLWGAKYYQIAIISLTCVGHLRKVGQVSWLTEINANT